MKPGSARPIEFPADGWIAANGAAREGRAEWDPSRGDLAMTPRASDREVPG